VSHHWDIADQDPSSTLECIAERRIDRYQPKEARVVHFSILESGNLRLIQKDVEGQVYLIRREFRLKVSSERKYSG
jgi:hypothetical protein